MNKLFYPKLALSNMKKNGKFYFPYMITCIISVAMFYIMGSIVTDPGINKIPHAETLMLVLDLGTKVIGIFSVIFLFYTNSFLLKRRKKELGLYNILGMERKHIYIILFFETIYLAIVSITAGFICGLVLSKLIIMLLCKMISFTVPLGFHVSLLSMQHTGLLFTCIFFAILLFNLIQIRCTKPIDLLHGQNIGEKEPKVKWLFALIGLILLGIGYYISITTESPLDALNLFFVAVLFVIIGTYFLFTAGSIALLKLLKKNKSYYYQVGHFTTVSGMMYRMKQNAVGLANICVLSTMVLVMISTSVCLYVGAEDSIHASYPYDYDMSIYEKPDKIDRKQIETLVEKSLENYDLQAKSLHYYSTFSTILENHEGTLTPGKHANFGSNQAAFIIMMTEEDYARNMGIKPENLNTDEIKVFTKAKTYDTYTIYGKELTCVENLTDFPEYSNDYLDIVDTYIFVVSDTNVLHSFAKKYTTGKNDFKTEISIDYKGSEKNQKTFEQNLLKNVKKMVSSDTEIVDVAKQEVRDMFYGLYGGLLFLGIFLGLLFLMATALIIYYKQISEGYDDRDKFIIMEKVGMTKQEVKKSIHSQILTIFFLPLIVAGCHVAGAFPLIRRILALLGLTNITLFVFCIVITLLIFGILYALVYGLTAKVYYKIVSR